MLQDFAANGCEHVECGACVDTCVCIYIRWPVFEYPDMQKGQTGISYYLRIARRQGRPAFSTSGNGPPFPPLQPQPTPPTPCPPSRLEVGGWRGGGGGWLERGSGWLGGGVGWRGGGRGWLGLVHKYENMRMYTGLLCYPRGRCRLAARHFLKPHRTSSGFR